MASLEWQEPLMVHNIYMHIIHNTHTHTHTHIYETTICGRWTAQTTGLDARETDDKGNEAYNHPNFSPEAISGPEA